MAVSRERVNGTTGIMASRWQQPIESLVPLSPEMFAAGPRLQEHETSGRLQTCGSTCGWRRIGDSFDAPVLWWHDIKAHDTGAGLIDGGEDIVLNGLTVSPGRRQVLVNGEPVPMPQTEFLILLALAYAAPAVVSHVSLMRYVRGEEWLIDKAGAAHVSRVNIARVRLRLIGKVGMPASRSNGWRLSEEERYRYIKTRLGAGYYLDPEPI